MKLLLIVLLALIAWVAWDLHSLSVEPETPTRKCELANCPEF